VKHVLIPSLALLAIAPPFASGQVTIREACASNVDLILDEDGNSSDWIELWNGGAEAVDLAGWHLSDDPSAPLAWTFPGVTIQPDGRLLIWASGKGEDHPIRPRYHSLVTQGSEGAYLQGTAEPPTTWRDVGFDDSSWAVGPSGYGFGDNDDATVVTSNTVYVRHEFKLEVKQLRIFDSLSLHVDFDDGYIAYLNGHEISRENMPGAPGTHAPIGSLASGSHEALLYQGQALAAITVPDHASLLRGGENVLSIQIHNRSLSSDDLSVTAFLTATTADLSGEYPHPSLRFKDDWHGYALHTDFKLSSAGEELILTDGDGVEAHRLTLPRTYANTSFGISDVGGAGAGALHFLAPTPAAPNMTEGRPGYAPEVSASPEGAMTASAVNVSLSSTEPTAEIRYSIDCTEPDEQSPLYVGAIGSASQGATILRARSFQAGLWPGPISTNTYLVNAAPSGDLPVFSLVTEPDNLWDPEIGIYILGPNAAGGPWFEGANFWNDWERPLHTEFFEADGVREVSMDMGTKIHGGYSRTLPQKSLRLIARGGYGESDIVHEFFEDVDNAEFKELLLRNSGNDFYFGTCRDPLTHLASDGSGLDDMSYRPTVLYLNGEYWGLMGLRERQDEDYLAYHHDVDPDRVDLLEHNASVIEGSNEHYQEMLNYLRNNDMSDDAHYDVIASMIDTNNHSHYFAHQIWANNTDWPQNNIKFWRSHEPGSKWRWLLYDTDFGLGLFGGPYTANSLTRLFDPNAASPWSLELFLGLMENDGHRDHFIRLYADLLNTSLAPAALLPIVDEVEAAITQDIPDHHALWNGSFSFWQSQLTTIRTFISNRPGYCRDHVRFQFQLAGMYDLTLDVSPPSAGRIQLTAAEIDSAFTGTYFLGVPVKVHAIPNTGYVFSGWSDPNIPQSPGSEIDPVGDYGLTALFTQGSGGQDVVLNEIQYNPSRTANPGDWVELHNPTSASISLDGWSLHDEANVYPIPLGTVIPASGYLVLCSDLSAFSAQFPATANVVGGFGFGFSGGGERVELHAPSGIHDSVEYDDAPPWPVGPDGNGTTLELIDAATDNALATSWAESSVLGGTPGAQNSVTP